MPRKNKSGRPAKMKDIKQQVRKLRDMKFSYAEIAKQLSTPEYKVSAQLAWWHRK